MDTPLHRQFQQLYKQSKLQNFQDHHPCIIKKYQTTVQVMIFRPVYRPDNRMNDHRHDVMNRNRPTAQHAASHNITTFNAVLPQKS